MENIQLTESEQKFYQTVTQAIFANPFGVNRAELDRLIVGQLGAASGKDLIAALIAKVRSRLERTFAERPQTIALFKGEDKTLVLQGVLFLLYHRYCDDFDRHIQEQINNNDEPCKVVFAPQLLAEMNGYGLTRNESLRYLALFFQMRRAFYFINQIIGKSSCMKGLRRDLWNNIFTYDLGLYEKHLWNRMEDFSTMLLGQTGTGKGLAASAIGRSGFIPFDEKRNCFVESFTRAFVSLNLSQYPEQLLESELFGHKKGAFTGAVENHEGVFARCSQHGAIFLDEIGDVTVPVQIKLLQIFQERSFSAVGSHVQKRFHGRVIAATNRAINELRAEGSFRDDFYYRLCSDIITVPPLSQRLQENANELNELLSHVVATIVGKSSPELVGIVGDNIKASLPPSYPWPGNVRELAQCVRRILLKQRYEGDRAVLDGIKGGEKVSAGFEAGVYTAQELLSIYCQHLHKKFGTYEEVARLTGLDRRTVKKHIDKG